MSCFNLTTCEVKWFLNDKIFHGNQMRRSALISYLISIILIIFYKGRYCNSINLSQLISWVLCNLLLSSYSPTVNSTFEWFLLMRTCTLHRFVNIKNIWTIKFSTMIVNFAWTHKNSTICFLNTLYQFPISIVYVVSIW